MYIPLLFKYFFISTIISKRAECHINIQNKIEDSEINIEAERKATSYFAIPETTRKENWKIQEERNITNQTPILLKLIINLNIITEPEKKQKKRKKTNGKNNKSQTVTKEKVSNKLQLTDSEKLAGAFERIKLKMENQRKKRYIEEEDKSDNKTDKDNIEDISIEKIPGIPVLDKDEEINASRWLKNWKDLLAIDPVLRTEKPTIPEAKFIDEWRYSYRVTLYNSNTYNISNFVCSGLLVSSQWVLTSMSCKLEDDVTLLIGVHNLPETVLEHNRYRVSRRVYSLKENLELIQMDRPVQWEFRGPEIGSVKMEEMLNLLKRRRCQLLSWLPVDLDRNIFELRQYPRLVFEPDMAQKHSSENTIRVAPSQHYRISRKDTGSPVVCDDLVVGIVLDVDELEDSMTLKLLCPVMEWVTFFTKERTYFEVAARKIKMKNSTGATKCNNGDFLIISLLFLIACW